MHFLFLKMLSKVIHLMIKDKSLKKNAFFNVLKTLMGILFPLITFPYTSRILLPDGLGKVNFANSIISYFTMIASLGIAGYGIREAAKKRKNKQELSQFFIEIFTINIISTIISYILLFLAIQFIPKFSEYRILLLILSISILFSTIGVDWMLGALEEYGFVAIRSFLIQLLCLILLFLFVKSKEDYYKYVMIIVISSVGSNIFNLFHLRKFISFKQLKKLQLRQHLKPIFIFFGSSIAISIFTMLDTTMLGMLSDDTQVGYYSASIKVVHLIRNLFPAIFTVMFAQMSIMVNENNQDRLRELINKTLCLIMCLSFPIISGLFILARPVIFLLAGTNYMPAVSTMYTMIPLIFFSSVSGFLGGNVLNSQGKEKTYLCCVIIGAVSDFVLNFLLIPKHGSLGAGIATITTEIIIFILYIFINKRFVFSKQNFISFAKYLSATLVMTICCIFTSKLFYSEIFKLIFTTILGIIVYFIMLLLFKDSILSNFISIIKVKLKINK